jgi:cytidine deaminase
MKRPPSDRQLLAAARRAAKNAYAPYSKFKVGAALLCKDGSVVTGCNVENVSYGLTICAERVAIGRAIAEGKRAFVAIAVAALGKMGKNVRPCGACRQVLAEFLPGGQVICGDQSFSVSELLPRRFVFLSSRAGAGFAGLRASPYLGAFRVPPFFERQHDTETAEARRGAEQKTHF